MMRRRTFNKRGVREGWECMIYLFAEEREREKKRRGRGIGGKINFHNVFYFSLSSSLYYSVIQNV